MFRIYRNLHKQCWTIQHKVKGKGWRVSDHADVIEAPRCTFKIYKSGRDRVLAEGKKYVHAYAIVDDYTSQPAGSPTHHRFYTIGYNPYSEYGFTDGDFSDIEVAHDVRFNDNGSISADRTLGTRDSTIIFNQVLV